VLNFTVVFTATDWHLPTNLQLPADTQIKNLQTLLSSAVLSSIIWTRLIK